MASTNTAQFIVGIGASADGITAMRTLLQDLPVEPGLAYVLVQHLDPEHMSALDEILERAGSKLTIRVVEPDLPLQAGCLFIVPPRGEYTLHDGAFHLENGEFHPPGLHPVDTLLTSMAEAFGDRAAAIILSGAGSDGLQGVRAIKGAGGTALIQDPEDAEHPGVPQAVIQERLADVIAPPDGLGQALQQVLHRSPTETPAADDEQGEPSAIATTERAVTLERTARAQRRHARLAHEERLTTAGKMAAGLAHELNQPLTAIMHLCDLASSIARALRGQRREELQESLDGISQQAERAGAIIRNLRQFVGRLESPHEPHDLNDVICETVSFMHWDLEHSDVTVELDLAEGLEPLTMDRSQVQQVLVNLLRNSTDAMVEGASPKRFITISTAPVRRDDFSGAHVTVRDSGPGVPQKVAALLFNPFRTTKANGLGMGLWISRSIVEAHGGRLWADPDDATGAAFHFTLRSTAGQAYD